MSREEVIELSDKAYSASYTVQGGIFCFGGLSDNVCTRTRVFQAKTDTDAFYLAFWYTHFLSMEHLIGRDGKKTVTLDFLKRPDGIEIDQRQELRRYLAKKRGFNSNQLAVLLEHFPGRVTCTSTFEDHLKYEYWKPKYQRLGFLRESLHESSPII